MTEQFDDCKTAKLHLIGKIQDYGALLALDAASGLVVAGSENAGRFLVHDAADLIGRHWSELFEPKDLQLGSVDAGSDLFVPTLAERVFNGEPVIISSHPRGTAVIVELEPKTRDTRYDYRDRLGFLQNLSRCSTAEAAAAELMRQVALITGFDRVMLYRFLPHWHGEVIAEQNRPGVQGFLGLRFPAGDIPENARRLYTINMQRIIADVSAPAVDIIASDTGRRLDLTYSQLRAVHPVHIRYLQNIGAQASFSVSIVVAGRLWGMVACHHLQPVMLGFRSRNLCEELSRIVSLHMAGLQALEAEQRRSFFFAAKSAIQAELAADADLGDVLRKQAGQLLAAFAADGFWVQVDGSDLRLGSMDRSDDMTALADWLAGLDRQQVFHTSTVPAGFKDDPVLVRHASGILHVPLGERGFVTFCRDEQPEHVHWAGSQEAGASGGKAEQLTPRTSFQAWTEEVRGQSSAWHEVELESAARLRDTLLGHLEKSELAQMALHDALTGLPNRTQFEQELDTAIDISRANGAIVAVFMLDLDKFKPVNDTWGHAAGDELLVQVGARLKQLVRGRDVVARFGGDEFAIILYHFSKMSTVEAVAGRILEELRRPFQLELAEVRIGVSIGIALYPGAAGNRAELIEKADAALYEVKRSGRNAYRFYAGDAGSQQ